MSEDPMDKKIKAHYKSKQMSADKLSVLEAMITSEAPAVDSSKANWLKPLMAIAALALIVVLWFIRDGGDTGRRVAEEVVMNHAKNLEVEHTGSRVLEVQNKLTRLDFSLVTPERFRNKGMILQGGRYCSLQGVLAAQLQGKTSSGRRFTMYQAPIRGRLTSLEAGEWRIDGYQVKVWKEKGLVIGLCFRPDWRSL